MTTLHKRKIMRLAQAKVFDLVDNVEDYPSIITYCQHVEVIRRTDAMVDAQLKLGKGLVSYTIRTQNTRIQPTSITMNLVKGPFSAFSAVWEFKAVDAMTTDVAFAAQYQFTNKLLGKAFDIMFDAVFDNIFDSLQRQQ